MERGAEERSRWERRLVWVALLVLSLSAMLAAAGPALADQAVYFDDVLPNHPYYDAVNGLYVAGVIDGAESVDSAAGRIVQAVVESANGKAAKAKNRRENVLQADPRSGGRPQRLPARLDR